MRLKTYWPAALLILLASCNLDEKDTHKKPVQAAVRKTGDTPTVKVISPQPQDKPEPGQYCLIKRVYDSAGATWIDADYIQFLMGDAAIAAAKKKGQEEMVMDDYWVVNDNTKIRTLKLNSRFEYIAVYAGLEDHPAPVLTAMQHLQGVANTNGILILTFNKEQEVTRIKYQFLP
ncbi:MAG TPA: hypothetical protein VLD19_15750 [Chitinophagaceae bacterium]|nr:hypothetical protein [Chitinophagaceae bacterium]